MKYNCSHCQDRGWIPIEPGSTTGYTCPDCCDYEEEEPIEEDCDEKIKLRKELNDEKTY